MAAYNWKIIGMSLITVFIAIFGIFYVVNNIARVTVLCETNKNFNFCSVSSLPVVILIALLMIGGLITILNIAAYILLTGRARD